MSGVRHGDAALELVADLIKSVRVGRVSLPDHVHFRAELEFLLHNQSERERERETHARTHAGSHSFHSSVSVHWSPPPRRLDSSFTTYVLAEATTAPVQELDVLAIVEDSRGLIAELRIAVAEGAGPGCVCECRRRRRQRMPGVEKGQRQCNVLGWLAASATRARRTTRAAFMICVEREKESEICCR